MPKILSSKNLFENISAARYNAAVWQDSAGTLLMLLREVEKIQKKSTEPDFGRLILVEFDEQRNMVREQTVWEPTSGSVWLEDPRALPLPDGSVLLGLTALLREKRGYRPYPAIIKLSRAVWREETLPAITVIERFGAGKNMTPVDEHTFFYRPDEEGYSHSLLAFSFHELVPRKLQDIPFPKTLEWAKWRIGTALPPVWIDENTALMIFHGITKRDGLYVYSLGRAKLERKDDVFTLTPAPEAILTPDDFLDAQKKPMVRELHPKIRRVVYACGGIARGDTLSLYVNVGDASTFEVSFSLADLKEGLW